MRTNSTLKAALKERALVYVSRRFDRFKMHGFVVGLGKWLLLHRLEPDSLVLIGYTALRLQDIEQVTRHAEKCDGFMVRATRKLRAVPQPRVSLSSARELLRTANRRFPALTIHPEKVDADVCFIGKPIGFSSTHVEFYEIDTSGHWHEIDRHALNSITRIDFGGGYENALAESAG
jgi:hypothetical protein